MLDKINALIDDGSNGDENSRTFMVTILDNHDYRGENYSESKELTINKNHDGYFNIPGIGRLSVSDTMKIVKAILDIQGIE